ncbi:MAG: mevalonate kinase [Candidatus Jordarchaeaceae archaeon]
MRRGKLSFFGEHAVVYGEPALVAAIDKRVYVTVDLNDGNECCVFSREYGKTAKFEINLEHLSPSLPSIFLPIWAVCREVLSRSDSNYGFNISIESDIPPAAGLGSSAAVSVATAMALNACLGLNLSKSEISKIAFEAEKLVHGTPSGIDNTIATYGSVILYKKGAIKPVEIKSKIPLVIGDTGVGRNTAEWVRKVKLRRDRQSGIVDSIINLIGRLVMESLELLEKNDLPGLGELMDINQGLLDAIGVSTLELNKLITVARKNGAYGAKLTGAGGGGCMIALSSEERQEKIADAILKAEGKPLITNISPEGVKIEG